MKRIFLAIFCTGLLISCKNNQEPTISKEEQENQLADQQFEQIDFTQVDEMPTFEQCNEAEDKQKCFEQNLSKLYNEALKKHNFVVGEALNDTILLHLKIDNTGKLVFEKTDASEKVRLFLPKLDSILTTETDDFQPIIPAKKQDVEVGTKCVLPLVINVK